MIASHFVFVFIGLSAGAFGLLGREAMNRRFGQASLTAYSSRTLPVSERFILLNFFVNDLIYYAFMFILPFAGGVAASQFFSGGNALSAFPFFLSLSLAFTEAMCISFALSTIYVRLSGALVKLFAGAALGIFLMSGLDAGMMLSSVFLFPEMSSAKTAAHLSAIVVLSGFSIAFAKFEFSKKGGRFRERLSGICSRLSSIKDPHFATKDFIDMRRSEGGIGKIVFSMLIPLAVVWAGLSLFGGYIPESGFLLVFSVLLGTVSSTIYNWLTEFDTFGSYSFLPVAPSDIILSKIKSYAIFNTIPLSILLLATARIGEYALITSAVVCFISVSFYILSATVWETGLYPNAMLYNATTLLSFLLLVSPALAVLMLTALFFPAAVPASVLLLIPSYILIKKGMKRWDSFEHPGY